MIFFFDALSIFIVSDMILLLKSNTIEFTLYISSGAFWTISLVSNISISLMASENTDSTVENSVSKGMPMAPKRAAWAVARGVPAMILKPSSVMVLQMFSTSEALVIL